MKAIITIHIISVAIFLILLIAQTFLLITNKVEALDKLKKAIKVPNMIISTIFLVTGFYMAFQIGMGNIGGWFHLKLTLVLAGIPLGIIAFKKNSKVLAVCTVLIYLYVYGVSETKSAVMGANKPATTEVTTDANNPNYDAVAYGKNIYISRCINCHGEDGKKMLMNASDLTASVISSDSTLRVIENGRNTMPAFSNQLTAQELEAVHAYAMSLRK